MKIDPLQLKALQEMGLTQRRIAERLGVNQSSVSRALQKMDPKSIPSLDKALIARRPPSDP